MESKTQVRLALCCMFQKEPIKFRRSTVSYLKRQTKKEQIAYLQEIVTNNTESLLKRCHKSGVGSFRVYSELWPCVTHSDTRYNLKDFSNYSDLLKIYDEIKQFAKKHDIRLTFHPDQFVMLNSTKEGVWEKSLEDLEYHLEMAELIGADVINLHGGASYGDKEGSLKNLDKGIKKLPQKIRDLLTLENDDKVYTPQDLYPICIENKIPMVYDVHHHRCNKDNNSVEKTTEMCKETWLGREPLFHISSPESGWGTTTQRTHHEYIHPDDYPREWLSLGYKFTLDVEARGKELAVLQLKKQIESIIPQQVPKYVEPTIQDDDVEQKKIKKSVVGKKNKQTKKILSSEGEESEDEVSSDDDKIGKNKKTVSPSSSINALKKNMSVKDTSKTRAVKKSVPHELQLKGRSKTPKDPKQTKKTSKQLKK